MSTPKIIYENGVKTKAALSSYNKKARTLPTAKPFCDALLKSLAKRSGHNRLDGMHAVLCLVKDDGLRALKHLVGDLHTSQTKLLMDLLSCGGLVIVESGQTMHEATLCAGIGHQRGIDLIGQEIVDALTPNLGGLAHRHPNVGIDNVSALGRRHGIGDEFKRCSRQSRNRFQRISRNLESNLPLEAEFSVALHL